MEFSTLVDALQQRARYQPEKKAYTFLKDGEIEVDTLYYEELERLARAIAAKLQSFNAIGQRALLMYPPGLEFISAFFGCLFAGVIAVPVYPPRGNQLMSRVLGIATDAEATFGLTNTSVLVNSQRWLTENPDLAQLKWLTTDNIDINLADSWQKPIVDGNSLALLQYTSGSTGTPKGVMVSHKNLLFNCTDLDLGWNHNINSTIVTWLPTFHDMGLIYGVIEPLYKGCSCYMMSPVSFLHKPVRWLKAISIYKATHSGAPNFAYDLCMRKITSEQKASLDLSSWRMALNGAEPVRADILQRFAQSFKPCGFDLTAFCPGYGLAEATLKVAAVRQQDTPVFLQVDTDALEINRIVEAKANQQNVQTLVGCGRSEIDTQILIVDPESLSQCREEQVGEIWVSGSTVAQGYWRNPEKTQQIFQATLKGNTDKHFLRTGDLGFIKNGELFVTGRLKDIIIIQGRNHYPQDIELTVENSHRALRRDCGAAFAVEFKGSEQLVVVQEVERSYLRQLDVNEVVGNIRQAVAVEHDIRAHSIVLIKTATIPKTSSGKIARQACRQNFLNNTLDVLTPDMFHKLTAVL
ncbi:fatty acyl-AMP ligase [Rivularia sp. UHCC 0363]|uniref:fatty acyl-AMP ligase n=1 Tax=Rivularia sp. UHCC 0363 TaxID=3110244 RepID=UPI002B1FFBBD|nr:fatty acyl-AMP ligase [Rivularia sp. UHCC 0363]MEA5595931.1 fatty acyl-AMP ligase [Rivularia sp. UHCC 0363]